MGLFDKVTSALGDSDDEPAGSPSQDEEKEEGTQIDLADWALDDPMNVDRRIEVILEHYDGVTGRQARTIAETLREEMGDGGYSMDSIRRELEDALDLDDDLIETIVWTESSSISNMENVQTYLRQWEPDHVFKLSVADDDRTHPICREVMHETEERGVPFEELVSLLKEKAEEYEEEGGTPERMDHWVPHVRCRHSFVRHFD